MNSWIILLVVFGTLLGGCNSTSDDPMPRSGLLESPGGLMGYQHGLEHSRFALGTDPRRRKESGFEKMVGSYGTFAVSAANGSVLAVQNADSPILRQPLYGTSPEDHSRRVLEYFLAVGIPKEQIAGVHATFLLEASGESKDVLPQTVPRLVAYYSNLERRVEGIPVVDSFAWARLIKREEVASEGVYWPSIPGNIIDEAKQFQARMSVANTREAYVRKLSIQNKSGQVVIRHASAEFSGPFHAFVSYDVLEQSERGGGFLRHFTSEGKEIRLPQELVRLPDDIRPVTSRPSPSSSGSDPKPRK